MKSEYRRNQILESAKKIFARHGYHKTNISMICGKAGIGRGTLYLYFENKEAVFSAILEDILDKMNQEIESIFDKSESEKDRHASPGEQIFKNKQALLAAHADALERSFMVWMADRDFARIAFEMSIGVSKEFTELRKKFDQRNISLIKSVLDQWKKCDFVRPDLDTELAAIQLRGAMEKIVITYFFDQKKRMNSQELKEMVQKVATLNLYGIFIDSNNR